MDIKTFIDSVEVSTIWLKQIGEIDQFNGSWKALKAISPERLVALKQVATIESTGASTRIEGSQMTDRQVETLLANIAVQPFKTRDEQEVAGYAKTMQLIFDHAEIMPFSENLIKQLHRDLLGDSDKDARHRGVYKVSPNHVCAFDASGKEIGVVFETASPFETPLLMRDLVDWANSELAAKAAHPLIVIAIFVVSFLAIHPFQDGNGRLSRILTTLLLLKSGYEYAPFSSMEHVVEQRKESYYRALRQTQQTLKLEKPNWVPWFDFFFQAMTLQKNNLSKKLEHEHAMLSSLPVLSQEILAFAEKSGRFTIKEVQLFTGANRNTLKKHLQSLVMNNQLAKHGAGRGTWYTRYHD